MSLKLKKALLFALLLLTFGFIRADEGLWIPTLLNYREADMKAKGFKLTAADIYSVNNSGLKDAVILFGSGCSGSIISSQGLILTNHHCGYPQIQQLSTMKKNYLENGFWSKNFQEELPCKDLTVSLLKYLKDVTKEVLLNIDDNVKENDRQAKIEKNIEKVVKEATTGTFYQASVKPLYYGNQYFLYVYEVYKDIRLVGAPPSSIGKFGGDTDNWMWPRHTGDFALFRIYTSPDGKPAEYSRSNIPYVPKKHFKISLQGYEEGDFTFVMGYPGRTQQYIVSNNVDLIVNVKNPLSVDLRTKRLDIIKQHVEEDPAARLMYASKQAAIANSWKKWQGETEGISGYGLIEKKKADEAELQEILNNDNRKYLPYIGVVQRLNVIFEQMKPLERSVVYYNEALMGVEILKHIATYTNLYNLSKNAKKEKGIKKIATAQKNAEKIFWKSYNKTIDEDVFTVLLTEYFKQDPKTISHYLHNLDKRYGGNMQKLAKEAFSKSIFLNKEKMQELLSGYTTADATVFDKDILFQIVNQASIHFYDSIRPLYDDLNLEASILYRKYLKALMEIYSDKNFYPDANLTMRLSYGTLASMRPRDGLAYLHYTTLDGLIKRENPNIYDFNVPPKLKELHAGKDYGNYANTKGELCVAFLASNHTAGGNSGSPVLNGRGELIGINFDRVWEGTMSDLKFDINRCRNISMDIRYALFIIDKYAGAKNLIDEMTLVK